MPWLDLQRDILETFAEQNSYNLEREQFYATRHHKILALRRERYNGKGRWTWTNHGPRQPSIKACRCGAPLIPAVVSRAKRLGHVPRCYACRIVETAKPLASLELPGLGLIAILGDESCACGRKLSTGTISRAKRKGLTPCCKKCWAKKLQRREHAQ